MHDGTDGLGDLLDLPADRGRLHALAHAGVLSESQLNEGLETIGHRPTAKSWGAYLHWHALILGVVLLVAGTIFFVAANWSALSGMTRIGIVAGAMISATLAGGYLGDSVAGRAASLLGGLLFGPLLAVFGQVYQTGADPWELFAWWTVVLAAYGVLARFVGTWIVALILFHIAVFTWMSQERGFNPYQDEGATITALLALFNMGLVAVAERFIQGIDKAGLKHSAALMATGLLLPFGVAFLIGEHLDGGALGLFLLFGGLVAIWAIYRWRKPDIAMLSILAGTSVILISTAIGHFLFEVLDAELFGVALLGLIICAQVWAFTRWLLDWRRQHMPTRPVTSEGGAA